MENNSEYEIHGSFDWGQKIVKSKTDGKLGVVNRNGEFFLPMCYDYILKIGLGIIYVKNEGKEGYLSENGEVLCPIVWDSVHIHEIEHHKDYLFHVEKDGKHGLIDKEGKTVIPIKYDYIYEYDSSSARVKLQGRYGIVDFHGNIIVPIKYDSEFGQVSPFMIGAKRADGKWDICHKGGEPLPHSPFDSFKRSWLGLIPVEKEGKWGFLDEQGKELVVPFTYDKVETYNYCNVSVYYYIVYKNNLKGHIGKNGVLLTPAVWDSIGHITIGNKHYFPVKKDGLYGFLNDRYEEIMPLSYEDFNYNHDNYPYLVVRKNGKYGSIDLENNIIVPFIYDEMCTPNSEGLLMVKKDGKYGFLDIMGRVIVPIIYDKAYPRCDKDYCGTVWLGNISGRIKENGQVVLNIKEYTDENGQVHESDQSSTGGTYIFTEARVVITADDEVIKLDDVLYSTRTLGDPGSVSYLKLMANGEREDRTDEFEIGCTHDDYYEYMDHPENELHIVTKDKDYQCLNDKDFLWNWLNDYFWSKKKRLTTE